jgi:hypothetical protein
MQALKRTLGLRVARLEDQPADPERAAEASERIGRLARRRHGSHPRDPTPASPAARPGARGNACRRSNPATPWRHQRRPLNLRRLLRSR